MTDPMRTTVSSSGTAIVRQRPSFLLLMVRLRVAELTMDRSWANLQVEIHSTSQLLKRLGAVRVEVGEPLFDEQKERNPLVRMQAEAARAMALRMKGKSEEPAERGVNAVITGLWDIASRSPEQILLLVDRLKFEAGADVSAGPPAEIEETADWESPVEQMQAMITKMNQPVENENAPQFLYIARLGDEDLASLSAEAFRNACVKAGQLARAANMKLGKLTSIHGGVGRPEHRPESMMEHQRCMGLLANSSYRLGENEIVADYPQSAEFTMTLHVTHTLE